MTEIWTGVALLPRETPTLRLRDMADLAGSAGIDGVWMGDHIALVDGASSRYPYSSDGSFLTDAEEAWYDWVVSLAALAGCTQGLRLGVGVCVAALRQPLLLAKQVATLDRLSAGRVILGVGVGWLAEEFAALGVPFEGRGARTDALLSLARAAWTGAPPAGQYGPYMLPAGVQIRPTPAQSRLPVLVAGDSRRAMRRALMYGDGWMTVADPRLTPIGVAASRLDAYRAAERDEGRLGSHLAVRVPARASMIGTPEFATYLERLVAHGTTGFLFDVNWQRPEALSQVLSWLRAVVAQLGQPLQRAPVDLSRLAAPEPSTA